MYDDIKRLLLKEYLNTNERKYIEYLVDLPFVYSAFEGSHILIDRKILKNCPEICSCKEYSQRKKLNAKIPSP